MKKLLLIPLLFILTLISVNAEELFLQNNVTEILEDTFIDADDDSSQANSTNIDIGESGTDVREIFIKFNIQGIPNNINITKVELGLFEFQDNTENPDDFEVREVDNQTWNENEVKNGTIPLILALISSTANPTQDVGGDGFILFDVLSWVNREFNLTKGNVSFNVRKDLDSGGADDTVKFRSKEYFNDSQRPFLNITFDDLSINLTNLDVFLSKNPVEILEEFTLFTNYTNTTDGQPIENAVCFANSSVVGGGSAGFGRGILGIGELSTLNNAVHTQVNDIFGLNTLRVDIDNLPLGKASYAVNFRFHAHNQTPTDNLRVFATCHNNLTFSNFTLFGQVNTTEAVISTSSENNTIWGFKNIVLFGTQVASENCSIVFESINTSIDKHWMIADTVSTLNLNNSFTSDDFGVTYILRTNADERSPFVDAGFGLDVPNETTMTFNSTSGLYFLSNIRHGRPFDFNDTVVCSADNFFNNTDFVITNVQDNVPPIVQINSIEPSLIIFNITTVTIQWTINDPELLVNFINVSFPDGTLLIQTEDKPLILTPENLSVIGNYTVIAFANDTGGLFTIANDTFEVRELDIIGPDITLVSPSNNTRNNTVPLPITFVVRDNSPNDIICTLSNSTNTFDSGTFIQLTASNLTLALGEIALNQKFPNLELTCFDNTLLNNSATLNLNYTLDTVPPIIFTESPTNRSRFNKDIVSEINIKANCTDVPIFRFNITISNSSDTIASFEDRSQVNNFLIIDEQLNIENLGLGNYTIDYICSDPHTKKDIPNYQVTRKNSENKIKWVTPGGNEYELKYINEGSNILNYGSEKHQDNDRYYFWYKINETEDGTKRTFTFELENRKFAVNYLPNSPYKAHFIMGNNWFDFEFSDIEAEYFVTLNQNNNYEISITTTKTILNFSSTGELNIRNLETQFELFFIEQVEDLFKVTECRTDTGSVLLLGLFFLIALFLITLGFALNIGFIGLFGALMLWVDSWFIASCVAILATMLTLLAMLLAFYFIFRGFFPNIFEPR